MANESESGYTNNMIAATADLVNFAQSAISMHTFGYRRFDINGKSFGFSTNDGWNKAFWERFDGNKSLEYEKSIAEFVDLYKEIHIRTGEPSSSSLFQQSLYEHKVWNSVVFYRINNTNNCIEAFFICAKTKDANIAENCINKIDFLNQWVDLMQARLNKCIDNKVDQYFSTTITNPELLDNMKIFIKNGNSNSCFFNSPIVTNGITSLSRRERQILSFISQGYKRNHMASLLAVSAKTIDTYTDRIKVKMNMVSKKELVKFIKIYPVHDFL